MTRGRSLVALILGLLGTLTFQTLADAGDTLTRIKTRGNIRCGVSDGIPGLSFKEPDGRWSGMDADFCRALSAAVLGDPGKVDFVSLAASRRFPSLKAGEIDVLVRNTTWTLEREATLELLPQKQLEHPLFCLFSLLILVLMILRFLFGEFLPFQLLPPAVAIVAASLALLIIYEVKVEPVDKVLRDVDWKTLLFLTCMFLMVEAFTRTGILHTLSRNMHAWFGTDLLLVGFVMPGGVAAASTVLANIPVVAAMVLLVKGYFVAAELVPEMAMGPAFSDWPAATLPIFVAMMFGGTLGGNATLIGASANVVSAGISSAHGKPISFATFARYGVPLTLCQLILSALYILVLHGLIGR